MAEALDIDALYARFLGDPDWAGFSFEDFLHDETEVCALCGERFPSNSLARQGVCDPCDDSVHGRNNPFTAQANGTLWAHNGSVVG